MPRVLVTSNQEEEEEEEEEEEAEAEAAWPCPFLQCMGPRPGGEREREYEGMG